MLIKRILLIILLCSRCKARLTSTILLIFMFSLHYVIIIIINIVLFYRMDNICLLLIESYKNLLKSREEFLLLMNNVNTINIKDLKNKLSEVNESFLEVKDFFPIKTVGDMKRNIERLKKKLNITNDLFSGGGIGQGWYPVECDLSDFLKLATYPNNRIKYFELNYSSIDNNDLDIIIEAIKNPNNEIEAINLEGNHIGSSGLKKLFKAFNNPNSNIISIDLDNNFIGEGNESWVEDIINTIKNPNNKIKKIYLYRAKRSANERDLLEKISKEYGVKISI